MGVVAAGTRSGRTGTSRLAEPARFVWQNRHDNTGKTGVAKASSQHAPLFAEKAGGPHQRGPRRHESCRRHRRPAGRQSTLVRRLLRRHSNAREERLDVPTYLRRRELIRRVSYSMTGSWPLTRYSGRLTSSSPLRPWSTVTRGREVSADGLRANPRPERSSGCACGAHRVTRAVALVAGELGELQEDIIDRLFADEVKLRAVGTTREDYVERLTRGGFPEAAKRDERRRRRFFSSYVEDLVARDVVQLADIQRRDEMHQLLRSLAGRCAQPLKIEQLPRTSGYRREPPSATSGCSKRCFSSSGYLHGQPR